MTEINWVKEETVTKAVMNQNTEYERWRAEAIASKMASEIKSARMDAYKAGYSEGWNDALKTVIDMLKGGDVG